MRKVGINIDQNVIYGVDSFFSCIAATGFEAVFTCGLDEDCIRHISKLCQEKGLTYDYLHAPWDKVNDLWAMARGCADELNASADNGIEPRKAFRKFRTELVRVYGLYAALTAKAQADSEKQMLDKLLDDMENLSRSAHEKYGFTPTPLKELAEFN